MFHYSRVETGCHIVGEYVDVGICPPGLKPVRIDSALTDIVTFVEYAMSPTMKDLEIDLLSPEQRIALALEIWESLGDDRPKADLTREQRAELARRDAELDARPEIGLTWEQIRASVEKKQ